MSDIINMIATGNYQTAGSPRIGTLKTTRSFSEITSPGYINSIQQEPISSGDLILANYGKGQTSLFTVSANNLGIMTLYPNNGYSSYINGLTVFQIGVTTLGVFPGACRDSTNSGDIIISGSSISIDITKNGINGLDVGSIQPNTWYAVYAVGDSSGNNSSGGIISLNGVSPAVEDSFIPPDLPPGYDLYRHIGWTYINNVSNIKNIFSLGNGLTRTYYNSSGLIDVLSGGNATSFAIVDLSSVIPNFYQFQAGVASRYVEGYFKLTYTSSANNSQVDFGFSTQGGNPNSSATFSNGSISTTKQMIWLPVGIANVVTLFPAVKYKTSFAGDSVSLAVSAFRDYL